MAIRAASNLEIPAGSKGQNSRILLERTGIVEGRSPGLGVLNGEMRLSRETQRPGTILGHKILVEKEGLSSIEPIDLAFDRRELDSLAAGISPDTH